MGDLKFFYIANPSYYEFLTVAGPSPGNPGCIIISF
jgi:hypothetical protein